ncbi:MAG: uroporphyrinogen-III synthase [Gammaproteobacteria bacterium]|nr:uroporphyrinogen-III synthase [Gammaproteobacteria bacterium]
MNPTLPLNNKTVLVTRPKELAEPLLHRINQAGGIALHYPVMRIGNVKDSATLDNIIDHLPDFDIAVFISPTAVRKTLGKIAALPDKLALAVIGRSTEAMLKKHRLVADIVPEGFDTESLLQHPALQPDRLADKAVVIFRGEGGRDLLAGTLAERGAKVTYAETYRREKNSLDSLDLDTLLQLDALTVTSNQTLQYLYELTEEDCKSTLTTLPLIVPGSRAYALALQLGFQHIIQADNATDDACLRALICYFSQRQHN